MVSALITTAGGSTSNSYGTLAEAATYFGDRINATDWTGSADDDAKSRALLQAAKDINALESEFRDYRYDPDLNVDSGEPDQALAFPRSSHYARDGLFIPQHVKDAQCEQALFLFRKSALGVEPGDSERVKSFRRGSVTVTYRDEAISSVAQSGLPASFDGFFSQRAYNLLRPEIEIGLKLTR